MKQAIILSLVMAIIWGTICSIFGVLVLLPLLGYTGGFILQLALATLGGWHCPTIARHILGVE